MRKSTIVGIVAIVLAVAVVPLAVAQATPSLKTLVTQIERQQNVKTIDQIDPSRVSDEQLAQLGEAVMDQMVPNEREHAYMDQMMGGEGSKTLEAMHRAMGYDYLANGGQISWGAMPFGPGMMGYGFRGGSPGYGPGYGYGPASGYGHHMFGWGPRGLRALWWILPIFVILLVIAVVVLAVLLATRRRRGREGSDDPLEILKRRYARGEISKEDYNRMKQEL
jgi:putative membrane protein